MPDREKVIAWLADEELYYRDHGDTHNSLMACNAIELLKEQDDLLRKLQNDKDKLCLEVSKWKHKYHDRPLKEQETEWCERCGRVRLKSKWEGEEVNG